MKPDPLAASDAAWAAQRTEPVDVTSEAKAESEKHRDANLMLADARPPEFSDEALALRFSEKHGAAAQFVATWNRWLHWTEQRWEIDATMRTYDLARAICRIASAETKPQQQKLASAIASAPTVNAVVSLARSDRRHAATVEQWDSNPWRLNTP